jgi:predicted porin
MWGARQSCTDHFFSNFLREEIMKRYLLGTSALVAASLLAATAPANAQSWTVAVKGDLNGFIGAFGETKDTVGGVRVARTVGMGSNSEIHFDAKVKLDNGLEVGARAELELERDPAGVTPAGGAVGATADVIDEYRITFKGGFGYIQFGQEDTAAEQQQVNGPYIDMGGYMYDPDSRPFQFGAIAVGQRRSPREINTRVDLADDDLKFNYFTPRFMGIELAFTYAAETSKNDEGWQSRLKNSDFQHIWVFSGNFEQKFNDVKVTASAAYGFMDREGAAAIADEIQPKKFAAGASISTMGFTLGGSYSKAFNFASGGNAPTTVNWEETNWEFGLKYATGPWSFAADYGVASREIAFNPGDAKHRAVEVGVNYDLGAGIRFGVIGVFQKAWVENAAGVVLDYNNGRGVIFESGVKF